MLKNKKSPQKILKNVTNFLNCHLSFQANYFTNLSMPPRISRLKGRKVYDAAGQLTVETEVFCIVCNKEKVFHESYFAFLIADTTFLCKVHIYSNITDWLLQLWLFPYKLLWLTMAINRGRFWILSSVLYIRFSLYDNRSIERSW